MSAHFCPICKRGEPHLHRHHDGRASAGPRGELLPVHDPLFNMQEACKQSLLLEQHLFIEAQRCKDCILKHFLTIEALLEEALMLDREGLYGPIIEPILPPLRAARRSFARGYQFDAAGQNVRSIRKPLMHFCFG